MLLFTHFVVPGHIWIQHLKIQYKQAYSVHDFKLAAEVYVVSWLLWVCQYISFTCN